MYDALEDSSKYYIVQELCRGGTLADYLSLDRGWGCTHAASSYGENAVASFARGILRALCHASDMGIVHGDIKASNVLLSDKSDDAEVKLCDFGCVAILENYSDKYMIVDKLSGTPAFMAPEMLAHKLHITSDIWALGVLVYQMLSGRLPFCKRYNAGMHETFASILNDKPDTTGLVWELISKDAIDFVRVCLDKNPESRPNARDLLQHPWLRGTACKDRFVGKPLPGLQAIYLQPNNELMQSLV
jgi:serine/threonine protein kinase